MKSLYNNLTYCIYLLSLKKLISNLNYHISIHFYSILRFQIKILLPYIFNFNFFRVIGNVNLIVKNIKISYIEWFNYNLYDVNFKLNGLITIFVPNIFAILEWVCC